MERLRVLTLNIWNRQGPWEARLPLIRRQLGELAPDLVGLQEVLRHEEVGPDQATAIAAGLGYHVAYGGAWELGGGLHFGNAVLSRFPILRQEVHPLPVDLPGGRSEESRCLLAVEIDAPCGLVPLFVTHLSWQLHHGALRLRQARHLARLVAAAASKDRFPPILLGDFNAEPDSDEIRFLKGLHTVDGESVYLCDCWAACDDGRGHTFARRNPFARLAHEPSRRLDYVFVRGPDRWARGEPLACRVVCDQEEDGLFPSDHFGVRAELRAAPSP